MKTKKCYTEIIISKQVDFKILNHRLRKEGNKDVCLDCGLVIRNLDMPVDAIPMFSIHIEEEEVKKI